MCGVCGCVDVWDGGCVCLCVCLFVRAKIRTKARVIHCYHVLP